MITIEDLEIMKEMWQDDWSPDLRRLVRTARRLIKENAELKKRLATSRSGRTPDQPPS